MSIKKSFKRKHFIEYLNLEQSVRTDKAMSEDIKKAQVEAGAPAAMSFLPAPNDKIFTEISEKVNKNRLIKNKNSVGGFFNTLPLYLKQNNLQECFVDKSRQMSFMMGSKDLCTNLKLQEKKRRFDNSKHLLPLVMHETFQQLPRQASRQAGGRGDLFQGARSVFDDDDDDDDDLFQGARSV